MTETAETFQERSKERSRQATDYQDEMATFDGYMFKLKRRKFSFIEETRLIPRFIEPKTKRIDYLELLALTVELAVKDIMVGVPNKEGEVTEWRSANLTPDGCRGLGDDAGLAWFLINWLCSDTTRNISPQATEDLRKKCGP